MHVFEIIFVVVTSLLLYNLAMVIYSCFTIKEVGPGVHDLDTTPLISILINLKNDENYVNRCLKSILSQDYNNFEIIIYNDHSTDNSLVIADEYTDKTAVKIVPTATAPKGWRKENWILYNQLKYSSGSIILLIDVRVHLKENALNALLYLMQAKKKNMLYIMPKIKEHSMTNILIVPLFYILFLSVRLISHNKLTPGIERKHFKDYLICFNKNIFERAFNEESMKNQEIRDKNLQSFLFGSPENITVVFGGNSILKDEETSFAASFDNLIWHLDSWLSQNPLIRLFHIALYSTLYILPLLLCIIHNIFIIPILIILLISILSSLRTYQSVAAGIFYPVQALILFFAYLALLVKNKNIH